MAPPYSTKQLGFSDERRRSGPGGGGDSYRHHDRDRDRDRDRDVPSRSGERPSFSRRESDSRDYRDDQDRSHDRERDRAPKTTRDDTRPLDLQLNTNIPTGPRNHSLSSARTNSPLSTRSNPPPAPAWKGSVTTPNALSAASPQPHSQFAPKAKDPNVQPILDQLLKWEDAIRKRTLVSSERDKKKREMGDRDRGIKNLSGNRNDNASVLDCQQRMKDRDLKEWKDIDKRFRAFDEQYAEYTETIATTIYNATKQPDVSSTQSLDPSAMADLEKKMEEKMDAKVSALEKRMADKLDAMEESQLTKVASLEKALAQSRTKITVLESSRNVAAEEVKGLQFSLNEALKKIVTVEEKNGASAAKLLSNCSALETQQLQLQSDNNQVHDEIFALKNSFSEREGKVDDDLATIRTVISTKASTDALDVVYNEHSEEITQLQKRGTEQEKQLVALKSTTNTPPSLASIQNEQRTLTDEIATIEELRKDMAALQQSTAPMERQFQSLDFGALQNFLNECEESGTLFKLPQLENDIEYLRHEIKKLKGQGGRLVQEPTPPVPDDGLRKDISFLQDGDRQKTEELKDLRSKMKTNMEKLVTHVNNTMMKQMVPIVTNLDDLAAKIKELESNPGMQNAPAAAQAPDLTGYMTTAQFDGRINVMKQELPALVSQLVQREATTPLQTQIQGIHNGLVDVHGRTERMSLEVGSLNSQFQNIWSKPLWDQICAVVDQNYSMYRPMIDANARKLAQIEEKLANILSRLGSSGPPKRPGPPLSRPSSVSGDNNATKRQRLIINTVPSNDNNYNDNSNINVSSPFAPPPNNSGPTAGDCSSGVS
ncbi:hypothetical protein PGQ11_009612 [Apiospora arundinis]|uniref:Uncharacterized protein n=1 Tax=Apiospora arundinis TaxID=335852 RepID=A0ABR2III5_9PEZI